MTSEAAGASKRHDDHSAVGSLVERPVRPAAEARWYCLDRDGVAFDGEALAHDVPWGTDPTAATRRAIVLVAADMAN